MSENESETVSAMILGASKLGKMAEERQLIDAIVNEAHATLKQDIGLLSDPEFADQVPKILKKYEGKSPDEVVSKAIESAQNARNQNLNIQPSQKPGGETWSQIKEKLDRVTPQFSKVDTQVAKVNANVKAKPGVQFGNARSINNENRNPAQSKFSKAEALAKAKPGLERARERIKARATENQQKATQRNPTPSTVSKADASAKVQPVLQKARGRIQELASENKRKAADQRIQDKLNQRNPGRLDRLERVKASQAQQIKNQPPTAKSPVNKNEVSTSPRRP